MGYKMRIDEKLDMFLMGEAAGAKLTPYAKSAIKLQDKWTKEELNSLVSTIAKNAKDDKSYEVTFSVVAKDRNNGTIQIFRKGDDMKMTKMSKEEKDAFMAEIKGVLKGTNLKIVGTKKNADWIAAVVSK